MRRNLLIQSIIGLCLGLGVTMTAMARDTIEVLDPPEVKAELEKARKLAGDDKYFLITERLQCRDLDENGMPTGPPGNYPGSMAPEAPTGPDKDEGEESAVPTKMFDNLYFVGGTGVGSWIFTTSDGYIMVDAGYNYSPEKLIIPGMKKLGLDPAKTKYVLITHAGPDHVGGAKYFQDNYGARIMMSAQEWDAAERPARVQPAGRERPPREIFQMPKRDLVGTDGQTLTLGDTTVTIVHTPRQVNGGGLSYIIPVFDNGTPHMWATYGNTNCVGEIEDKLLYRASVAHFLTYLDAAKVDVVISSHPFVDGSLDRMVELRNRKKGEPNPFVIGQEGARRYLNILDQCAAVFIAREQAGLDGTGTMLLKDMPKRDEGGGPRP